MKFNKVHYNCLLGEEKIENLKKIQLLRSKDHEMYSTKNKKIAVNSYDGK